MTSQQFNDLLNGYIADGSGIYKMAVVDKPAITEYTDEMIEGYLAKAWDSEQVNYPGTDKWLHSLMHNTVENCDWLVVGSGNPWYEAVALRYGALFVDVLEQRGISYKGDAYPINYTQTSKEYDYILNISTVEHAGLGRYGDELNPDGDLKLMASLRDNMHDKSLMFLAVPMNPEGGDLIMWPAHRVYGKKRINKLLEGYKVLDFMWDNSYRHQPLYMLGKA